MSQQLMLLLGKLLKDGKLTRDEIGRLATHYRYLYDDWNRQGAELITLRERVRLLVSENEFLTGMLQEE